MQGSEKIQGARCIQRISGLDFFADEADCRFGAACSLIAQKIQNSQGVPKW
jgi:hypothetical protein